MFEHARRDLCTETRQRYVNANFPTKEEEFLLKPMREAAESSLSVNRFTVDRPFLFIVVHQLKGCTKEREREERYDGRRILRIRKKPTTYIVCASYNCIYYARTCTAVRRWFAIANIRLFTVCRALYSKLFDDVLHPWALFPSFLHLVLFYANMPKPSILIACASQVKAAREHGKPLDAFYNSVRRSSWNGNPV